MSFVALLRTKTPQVEIISEKPPEILTEEKKSAEEILRDSGYKIKLVHPTAFGTQIDFARKYEDAEIEEILKGFEIKIKNKSVFIIT